MVTHYRRIRNWARVAR